MRLYADFIDGTLSVAPTDSVTTLEAAVFADLPVVAGSDTLLLTIDPRGEAGAPELVRVTAHTAAATTVTVTRGVDGTTARSHLLAVRVIGAWAASDAGQLRDDLGTHVASVANPHTVTAAQVSALALAGGTVTGNVDVTGRVRLTAASATEGLQFDSDQSKRITWGDGSSLTVRSGSYLDGATERYVNAGDGVAIVRLVSDGAEGSLTLAAGAINMGAAGAAVPALTGLVVTPTEPRWGSNRIFHLGNDGAGSGLDADLLDGVQGANFARSDVTDTVTTLRFGNGTAGAPSVSFSGDTNTGLYWAGENLLGFASGGVLRFTMSTDAFYGSADGAPSIRRSAGSEALPSYSFVSDPDTGIRRSNTNELGIVAGGNTIATVTNARFILEEEGSAGAPALVFREPSGPMDTGIYHNNSLNRIGFTIDGGVGDVVISQSTMSNIGSATLTLGAESFRWGTLYTTTAVNVSSDVRLKDNVRPNGPEHDRYMAAVVEKVAPTRFVRHGSDRDELGFIAQDVALADSRLVDIDENGFLSIYPDELLSTLWGAVRDLIGQVRDLSEEVARLTGER